MRIRARMDSIQRLIRPLIDQSLSPQAQSRALAARAEQEIDKARAQNRRAMGREVAYTVEVDGKKGAPMAAVKPEGRIVAEFELAADIITWIRDELVRASPVLTGAYQRSHRLFVDGLEASFDRPPAGGKEYVFLSEAPYARKIEPNAGRKGQSKQAPDGVYNAIAETAGMKYDNIAQVFYSFRSILGSGVSASGSYGASKDTRQPAIVVRIR